MKTYQVWMKGTTKCIELQAEDVDLDSNEGNAYWNFTAGNGSEDSVTVGAFPFAAVEYIVSVS